MRSATISAAALFLLVVGGLVVSAFVGSLVGRVPATGAGGTRGFFLGLLFGPFGVVAAAVLRVADTIAVAHGLPVTENVAVPPEPRTDKAKPDKADKNSDGSTKAVA